MIPSTGQVHGIARMFRWPIVAGAVVVVAFAVAFWVLTLTSARTFHGSGATGSPVAITGSADGSARLDVYTDRPSTAGCTPSHSDVYFFAADLLEGSGETTASLHHDGRSWFRAGYLTDGWRAGQSVTCPAQDGSAVLLSVDQAAAWREPALALTGGGIFLAIGAAVFVALGREPDHSVAPRI